jgi:hypothetical protein
MTNDITEAKRLALEELHAYRERNRRDQEVRAAASESAEAEIARTISARREHEAATAKRLAALATFYAERDAAIEAERQAEKEARLAADPRLRIAETPARRLAKLLRRRLGDDFDAFAADLRQINFKLLQIEIARIPQDEQAEALHRQREEAATKLQVEAEKLPTLESEQEVAIFARHGFPLSAIRRAELDAGAL